jgi:hypothetical protein
MYMFMNIFVLLEYCVNKVMDLANEYETCQIRNLFLMATELYFGHRNLDGRNVGA